MLKDSHGCVAGHTLIAAGSATENDVETFGMTVIFQILDRSPISISDLI